jgi:peptide/nickel transport system substrate-binding protein
LKKLRWQVLVVFLALIGIGALLLSQDEPLIEGGETSEQPVVGGSYSEALIGKPSRLNPLLDFYNQVDFDLDQLIYSGLVRFDDRGLPHGDLAETWGISKDGTKYSFSIRSQAVWHDGTPLTSEDVVFTVSLLQNEGLPIPQDLREFWSQVNVIALDEKTLQFELPEAFSPFLDYLSFGILPRHLFGDLDPQQILASPLNLQPVGSGAYRFKTLLVEDDQITGIDLETFEDYYGDRPFIQDLSFRYYSDAASAMDAFEQGQVKGVSQIPTELLPRALQNENLSLFTGRLPKLTLVYLNLDSKDLPFFRESEVRRALMMGINRRWIADRLLFGQAILADGPIFPENWAYYSGTPHHEYNPEQAIADLKEAGYTIPAEGGAARAKEGVALRFELAYPEGELYRQIAERIQQDWSRLGVSVTLQEVPNQVLISDYLEPRTYQAALVELDFSRSPDPDPYPFWHQAQITSGQNYAQFDDRQVSEYLEQARVLDDISERTRRYRNFQVRWVGEMPALPLFYPTYSYAVDANIFGVSMGPLYDPSDRFDNLFAWYLQTAPQAQLIVTPTAGN